MRHGQRLITRARVVATDGRIVRHCTSRRDALRFIEAHKDNPRAQREGWKADGMDAPEPTLLEQFDAHRAAGGGCPAEQHGERPCRWSAVCPCVR